MPKPCPRYRLFNQDCLEVAPELESKSIDTVICDPPYGLNFMGKQWDHGVPGMLFWARIRKVCKPGALLLAFGGTRTYHRLACAIEDGGWQIRDCMMWLYGSGFPKSYDLSKGLDADAGAEREVVGTKLGQPGYAESENTGRMLPQSPGAKEGYLDITAPATDLAKRWQGFGTSLKPSYEPIIVAMKPFRGTFVDNALAYAVAGFNIDAGRIGTETLENPYKGKPSKGWGHSVGGQTGANPVSGRWPANLVLSHHPECVQVGTKKVKSCERPNCEGKVYTGSSPQPMNRAVGKKDSRARRNAKRADADGLETVEAWECHGDCPVRMLDLQSIAGGMHSAGSGVDRQDKTAKHSGVQFLADDGAKRHITRFGDTGGASRFFYTAKASRREREDGLEELEEKQRWLKGGAGTGISARESVVCKNTHPTVKPLAIMEYLCRLTRPPSGGVVFDPFMGSGTTGVACANTKRKFIGCEIDMEHGYFEIARRRIKKAYKEQGK